MRILLASAPVINREIEFNLQTLLEYMKAYRGKVELIVFGESILQAARLVARIQDPSVSDDDLMKLQVDWKNPNTPSSSMSADAFSKLAGSIDSFANSEVGMTRAGLSRSEIVRLKADQRKAQAGQVLDQIRGMRQQTEQTQDDGERQTDASTQSTVAGGG